MKRSSNVPTAYSEYWLTARWMIPICRNMAVSNRHTWPWSINSFTLAPNAINVSLFSEPPFSSISSQTITLIAMISHVMTTRRDGSATRVGAGGGMVLTAGCVSGARAPSRR